MRAATACACTAWGCHSAGTSRGTTPAQVVVEPDDVDGVAARGAQAAAVGDPLLAGDEERDRLVGGRELRHAPQRAERCASRERYHCTRLRPPETGRIRQRVARGRALLSLSLTPPTCLTTSPLTGGDDDVAGAVGADQHRDPAAGPTRLQARVVEGEDLGVRLAGLGPRLRTVLRQPVPVAVAVAGEREGRAAAVGSAGSVGAEWRRPGSPATGSRRMASSRGPSSLTRTTLRRGRDRRGGSDVGGSDAVQPARRLGDRAAHRRVDREHLGQLVGGQRLRHRDRDRVDQLAGARARRRRHRRRCRCRAGT